MASLFDDLEEEPSEPRRVESLIPPLPASASFEERQVRGQMLAALCQHRWIMIENNQQRCDGLCGWTTERWK